MKKSGDVGFSKSTLSVWQKAVITLSPEHTAEANFNTIEHE
jgi:hypothetical protein